MVLLAVYAAAALQARGQLVGKDPLESLEAIALIIETQQLRRDDD